MICVGISNKETLQCAQANAGGTIIGRKSVSLLNETHYADQAIDPLYEALGK